MLIKLRKKSDVFEGFYVSKDDEKKEPHEIERFIVVSYYKNFEISITRECNSPKRYRLEYDYSNDTSKRGLLAEALQTFRTDILYNWDYALTVNGFFFRVPGNVSIGDLDGILETIERTKEKA